MAVRNISPSAANAGDGSVIGALVAIVNDFAAKFEALLEKLDAEDVTNMDDNYESTIGVPDTIAYKGGGTPT